MNDMDKGVPELLREKKDCCGCAACYAVCPVEAITMKVDDEGFQFPVIDRDKCIHCHQCVTACVYKKDKKERASAKEPLVYAIKNKSSQVLSRCSSGGAFSAFSDLFLDEGYALLATGYNYNTNRAEMRMIHTKEERDACIGSIYMQSVPLDTWKDAIHWLKDREDRKLAFFGMGCQGAAFSNFAGMKGVRDRVVIVDIICHGVPSPMIWGEYLKLVSDGKKVSDINMRDKKTGWNNTCATAKFDGREVSIMGWRRLYSSKTLLRDSCTTCPYTTIYRSSDITIGDFWHIEERMPDFYDEKGVSLILIHTDTGIHVFDQIKDKVEWRESNTKDCMQLNLRTPTQHSVNRRIFWKDYRKYGIAYVLKNYGSNRFLAKVKRKTKLLLNKSN